MGEQVVFRDHYDENKSSVVSKERRMRVVSEETGAEYWVDWKRKRVDWKRNEELKFNQNSKAESYCEVSLWKEKKRSGKLRRISPMKKVYYHQFYGTEFALWDGKVVDQMVRHTIQKYEKNFLGQAITPFREGEVISLEMLLSYIALSMIGVSWIFINDWIKDVLRETFGIDVFFGALLWLPISYVFILLLFWELGRPAVHPSRLETTVEFKKEEE